MGPPAVFRDFWALHLFRVRCLVAKTRVPHALPTFRVFHSVRIGHRYRYLPLLPFVYDYSGFCHALRVPNTSIRPLPSWVSTALIC
jgi:hypothetical protein